MECFFVMCFFVVCFFVVRSSACSSRALCVCLSFGASQGGSAYRKLSLRVHADKLPHDLKARATRVQKHVDNAKDFVREVECRSAPAYKRF